ncbi:10512_t:CDS:2 [Entrophospora sp. SA101]|nr:10512_t:CDS:2 [Entrophospora sp. SA101]CAJ0922855.1 21444_t:CDS:2 [Entrophospora sp. SA101]CAJ0922856.1 21445_t:CDS:2 [Entrophospora sp. SA101]
MSGLTLEGEPTHFYEEYAEYLTTNSEAFIYFPDDGSVRTYQVQVKVSSQNPNGMFFLL